jgi:8-oxo-dGTP diphosphatase
MSQSTMPRVGSALVVRAGDRILLGLRNKEPNRGRWVLPGGKVEPFESIADAAKREILEEAGLKVEVSDQIGVFEIIVPSKEHRLIVYSWARPVEGEGTLRANSDLSELRFCTRAELADMDLTDICREVLAQIGWLSTHAGTTKDSRLQVATI